MAVDLEKCVLGIEFGSTRIKGVLIDEEHRPIASGDYAWENRIEDGVFVYHLEDARAGLRACFRALSKEVQEKYGVPITKVQAIGISAMMHGYLVFDREWNQIAPYRSWRNVITGPASEALTELFRYNIPQRWSIAHLYQAILNGEEHVKDIAHLSTLSAYIHHLLTGENVVGIDEASGMFPYDDSVKDYDPHRMEQFDELVAEYKFPWTLRQILPKVLMAGERGGVLTAEGAALLDETGRLQSRIPLCPPEGDGATGMVAGGGVLPRTGSVSAGTSGYTMLVCEHPLKGYDPKIDVLMTPTGKTVAFAHINTCTPEINVWVNLMAQSMRAMGMEPDMNTLFTKLFQAAMDGDPDCGGCISYNYLAGEPLTDTDTGRPMFIHLPESRVSLGNFMRAQLYGAIATMKLGVDLLIEKEGIEVDRLMGQGGYFKTPGVGQQILADAFHTPITVLSTAGEGGPWAMALLAAYMVRREEGETMEDYLENRVFSKVERTTLNPDPAGEAGFEEYIRRYKEGLAAQKAAAAIC